MFVYCVEAAKYTAIVATVCEYETVPKLSNGKVSACNMNTVGNMDIPCKSSSLSCDLYIPVYIS